MPQVGLKPTVAVKLYKKYVTVFWSIVTLQAYISCNFALAGFSTLCDNSANQDTSRKKISKISAEGSESGVKLTVIGPGCGRSISPSSGLPFVPRRPTARLGGAPLTPPWRAWCVGVWGRSSTVERDDERLLVVRTAVAHHTHLRRIENNLCDAQTHQPHVSPIVSDVVEKTSTRRRSRIFCVVVEKITTRRREGVGVVVEKKWRWSTNFQQKNRVIYLQQ